MKPQDFQCCCLLIFVILLLYGISILMYSCYCDRGSSFSLCFFSFLFHFTIVQTLHTAPILSESFTCFTLDWFWYMFFQPFIPLIKLAIYHQSSFYHPLLFKFIHIYIFFSLYVFQFLFYYFVRTNTRLQAKMNQQKKN